MDSERILEGVAELALADLLELRLVQNLNVANPGAGAELVASAPGGSYWEVLALTLTLTTSAAVANRQVNVLGRTPDGATFARLPSIASITAGSAQVLSYLAGLGAERQVVVMGEPLPSPPLIIPPGGSIRTSTLNLDVGDAYSAIVLTVRQSSVDEVLQAAEWLGRRLT